MGLGHWTRAVHSWEEGIEGLRAHASPADLAHVLVEIARYCRTHGDDVRAKNYLLEARAIARGLGGTTLLSEVEGILAPLDEGDLQRRS